MPHDNQDQTHLDATPTPVRKLTQPGAVVWTLWLGLGLCGVSVASVALGESTRSGQRAAAADEEDIDYLSLAARLMKDGHYDRAERTLAEVDEQQPGLELMRLYTLRGLVYQKQQRHADARDNFRKAIDAGADGSLNLHLAQAHYELREFAETLTALDRAGSTAATLPGAYLIRAQCHWELQRPEKALAALAAGQQRFPEQVDFGRRRFFFLVDLGLFQEALDQGRGLIERADATEDDYVAIGEALRQAREYAQAESVLEAARLRFSNSERLTLLLAHTYLGHDRLLTAAMLFEQAAMQNPQHCLEAAELYRRAKRLDRALSLNARVMDQKAKMKQRMSILLQMERFDMVAAMAPNVSRLGLLEDEDIRYALAYAYFKTGDFVGAERELKRIQSPQLFVSATELRKMMQSCREAGWECM